MTAAAAPAVALEDATPSDEGALLAIERGAQTHPWTERNFRDVLSAERSRGHRVLVLRGPWDASDPRRGIVAYCVLQQAADEAQVHNLVVDPAFRRRGLGRRLLMAALGLAAREGSRSAHLEVRESNEAARALYAALGFREVGRRRGYYESPVEDAVLLSTEALQATAGMEP